jgi:hypothetical protein
MNSITRDQWGEVWLPGFPYAGNRLSQGIYRTSRAEALEQLHIQANPDAISNLLVVDIDHADAFLRTVNGRHGWVPNAVTENSANGHAHAIWVMKEPITRTEYARRKPLAYAAAVTEGLRRSVDGDKGYSGLMTKNPLHERWGATWLTDHRYSLGELHEHLDDHGSMPPTSWQRTKRRAPVGLGRNCTLFETARVWAYRRVRDCPDRSPASSAYLYDRIALEVHERNADFSEPLPQREAEAIARSIHKWIVTRSDMWADGAAVYEATLSTIQSHRGRKSGEARRADKLERVKLAIQDQENLDD